MIQKAFNMSMSGRLSYVLSVSVSSISNPFSGVNHSLTFNPLTLFKKVLKSHGDVNACHLYRLKKNQYKAFIPYIGIIFSALLLDVIR